MIIRISRHAGRQMKWRKITEDDLASVLNAPDMIKDSINGRKNALKMFGDRQIQVTYAEEEGQLIVITAIIKGR